MPIQTTSDKTAATVAAPAPVGPQTRVEDKPSSGTGAPQPAVVERDYPEWIGGKMYGPWVLFGLATLGAVVVGWAAAKLLMRLIRKLCKRADHPTVRSLVRHLERPLVWLVPLLLLQLIAAPAAPWPNGPELVERVVGLGMIGVMTMAVLGVIGIIEDWLLAAKRIDVPDNLEARKLHTQVRVIGRMLRGLIVFLGVALALISFPAVRQVGTSLLASAGIAGIIIGVAAGPVISNVLAGLQVAFTEPIRIDDVLVVEGEWGRVEEITTTFVVLRIWDERRLVVPLRYFIDKPIENWTRQSSLLTTTIDLFVDYSVPVEAIRQEARRLLDAHPLWDKRAWSVSVTNLSEQTMTVRVLATVSDGSKASDLQYHLRENLIAFLQRNFAAGLPQTRFRPADPRLPGGFVESKPVDGVRAE